MLLLPAVGFCFGEGFQLFHVGGDGVGQIAVQFGGNEVHVDAECFECLAEGRDVVEWH